MPAPVTTPALFPTLSPDALLAFQFSSWYPRFASHSIRSTVIRPLSSEFRHYLDSDGVFVPDGAEDLPAESTLSDDEDAGEDEEDASPKFAFPELDTRIREAIAEYGAVFPKLNFSSPRTHGSFARAAVGLSGILSVSRTQPSRYHIPFLIESTHSLAASGEFKDRLLRMM